MDLAYAVVANARDNPPPNSKRSAAVLAVGLIAKLYVYARHLLDYKVLAHRASIIAPLAVPSDLNKERTRLSIVGRSDYLDTHLSRSRERTLEVIRSEVR